ncbi:response regulator [Roseibium denhamense]|uniref:Response regulator receiver domain-containing protein n=1 Tax=Roseibium denhamense TaxID=76305 RepID=A0ABY1P672_9HYPH|nr:response regulator [Roseibium denhamense]SMP26523.1 Response regulator receiver domain-containing protein [Roseibium denhamense]
MIHIIEDDPAVADALAIALSDLDYRTEVYRDGETFLNEAIVSDSDFVIIDLGLPGMSGADVISHLQSQDRSPRVIVISGSPHKRLLRQLKGIQSLTILRKPLSMEMISEAIR